MVETTCRKHVHTIETKISSHSRKHVHIIEIKISSHNTMHTTTLFHMTFFLECSGIPKLELNAKKESEFQVNHERSKAVTRFRRQVGMKSKQW